MSEGFGVGDEAGEDRTFGMSSLVLDRSVGRRCVELMSGKGGLEALVMWMDQLDFVEGLDVMLNSISRHLMFFDMALTKCAKENLKRPLGEREEEVATLLGDVCLKCGKSYSLIGDSPFVCGCGGKVDSKYGVVVDEFGRLDVNPSPEAVLLWVAYEGYTEAYVLAFQAFRLALDEIVRQRGWDSAASFVDAELKTRLDNSYVYGEPGDLRLIREEREVLMFLTRGNLVKVPFAEAEKLIRAGLAVAKFGHIFNQLFCAGADYHYQLKRQEYLRLYNKVNERIRKYFFAARKDGRRKGSVEVEWLKSGEFFAFCWMPKPFWESGKLSNQILLKPLERIPFHTHERFPAINLFVGPSGSGKSTLMASLVCHSFERKHDLIFNVLGDEANSLTLAHVPLFPCEGYTGDLLEILGKMKVEPKGIPCLNLSFLRKDESIKKNRNDAHPPTKYDRIVEVDFPFRFGLDFYNKDPKNPGILNILEGFVSDFRKNGYDLPNRCCGIVNARNLCRLETPESEKEKDTNIDIVVASALFSKFDAFRQNNKLPSARLVCDEASYLAPVVHSIAGSDTSKSTSIVSQAVKRARKINCSFDLGTQKLSEINTDVRAEATNILFRELPKSGDRARSQQDIVLDSLLLKDAKNVKALVAGCIDEGVFPSNEFYWFWWHKPTREVEVVKPMPPYFMINQPNKTNLEVLKAYEKCKKPDEESVLLSSWDEVPRLHYPFDEYRKKFVRVA